MKINMSKLLLTRELRNGASILIYVEIDAPTQVSAVEWHCIVRYRDHAGSLVDEQTIIGQDALQSLFHLSDGIRNWLNSNCPDAEWSGLPVDLAFPRSLPASIGLDNYLELGKLIDDFLDKKFS